LADRRGITVGHDAAHSMVGQAHYALVQMRLFRVDPCRMEYLDSPEILRNPRTNSQEPQNNP
jgi:hypothetical protein